MKPDMIDHANKLGADMMRAQAMGTIMLPGVYPGVDMARYLDYPAFSSGVCNTLLSECAMAAWFQSWRNPRRVRETSDESDAGIIAHAILLEGSTDGVVVIDPLDHPAEKTGNIPIGWTNKSIKAARDAARSAGKIPVLTSDIALINAMVDSAHEYIESLRDTEPAIWAAFQPDGGDSELTCLWDDGGQLCRMRPDRISKDRRVIIDPKFSKRSAEPDSWSRSQISAMGYRISASFYRRGAKALFGTLPDYVFLVVEQEPPHLCSLVGMDPANIAFGDEQVEQGISEWRRCVAANHFPAYPARVCYPEVAAWEVARWADRYGNADLQGIPYDVAKLFQKREST